MAPKGSLRNPLPADTLSIEPKVRWAGIGFYLAGVVGLALVSAFTGEDNALLIEALPDVAEPFVLPLVPAVVGMVSAWAAKHQWRTRPGDTGSTELG